MLRLVRTNGTHACIRLSEVLYYEYHTFNVGGEDCVIVEFSFQHKPTLVMKISHEEAKKLEAI